MLRFPDLDARTLIDQLPAGEERFAAGRERHGCGHEKVPAEREGLLPSCGVPEPDAAVRTGRGEALAVRAKGDAGDVAGMTGQGEDELTRRRVPNPGRPVFARRSDKVAVGTERHVGDCSLVPGECEQLFAGRGVPDLDRAVFTRRG